MKRRTRQLLEDLSDQFAILLSKLRGEETDDWETVKARLEAEDD